MILYPALGVEPPAALLFPALRRLLLPMPILGELSLRLRAGCICSRYAFASEGLCMGYYAYTHEKGEEINISGCTFLSKGGRNKKMF